MTHSVSPFTLDSYGTRVKRINSLFSPDNPYSKTTVNIIAVLIFLGIDLYCLAVVWNLVQLESPLYAWAVALGCALALDVPMAIGAIALKKLHHGVANKQEAMITFISSVVVFVIAFAFSLCFRLVTKDLSFDIGTSTVLINTAGETATNTEGAAAIWFAALFNGIVPLLTSISSFVITYFSTDPVNHKLKTLETERITLQSNILEADTALAQCEDGLTHCKGLLAREKDLYDEFIEKINAESQTLQQLARLILMEKLGNSNDITALTESGKNEYNKDQHTEIPGENLAEFIDSKLDNPEIGLAA